jgi:hypothetical protein
MCILPKRHFPYWWFALWGELGKLNHLSTL